MRLKSVLNKLLPLSVRVSLFIHRSMDKVFVYGNTYRGHLLKSFEDYLPEDERNDEQLKKKLTTDIIESWILYKALPYEYFLYDFRTKNKNERSEFLTDCARLDAIRRVSDQNVFLREVNDKFQFYLKMKPYFKRNAFLFDADTSRLDFSKFVMAATDIFVKPLKGAKGVGAFSYMVHSQSDADILYDRLRSDDSTESWIVEEKIIQSKEMSQWCSSSVNTVRIPSFLTKDGVKILKPFFRTGHEGSDVDNVSSGGVFAIIDEDSGKIVSDGGGKLGHNVERHPDSNLTFKGWQIPHWTDLLQIVSEVHRQFPSQRYMGWDFAYTEQGWVLLEGNWGQMCDQYITKKGIKKDFLKYLNS